MAGEDVDTVAIPRRFNGPADSANGGYACGVVARLLGADAAEVSLRRPPPLDRPLAVEREGESVLLLDGGELVAEGAASEEIEVEPRRVVDVDEARRAGRRYPWLDRHPYPTCFVCGPRRAEDGLEVYAGATDDGELFAAEWTPSAEWSEDGGVREEIVWAVLDCPSAVPVMSAEAREGEAVLARLGAAIEGPVVPGRPHVVLAWRLGEDGRKRHSASAVLDGDGAVVARARALWITLRD